MNESKSKYKKTYKLKVMFAATKQYAEQYYNKSVEADRFYVDKGGVYVFTNTACNDIACYPTQLTIIEEIIDNE